MSQNVYDVLKERGYIQQTTHEEELREIHTDEAIEDAILEEKALEAPVQEETEVVSAGEESEAEDDTDKTKE